MKGLGVRLRCIHFLLAITVSASKLLASDSKCHTNGRMEHVIGLETECIYSSQSAVDTVHVMRRVTVSRLRKWQSQQVQVELAVRKDLHHVQVHLTREEDSLL